MAVEGGSSNTLAIHEGKVGKIWLDTRKVRATSKMSWLKRLQE
jgi:hypothetical protein